MTDLQCKYFLNLVNTKSITRCAQQYFISPSAVSQQVAFLEKEFNAALFTRSPRGMELTSAGQIVYNYCLSRQAALDTAVKRLNSLQSAQQAPLIRMGLREGWALPRQMLQLRQCLHQVASNASLDLHSLNLHAGLSALESGKLDAFLCLSGDRELQNFPEGVAFCSITQVERVFLFSTLSSLSHTALRAPSDFANLPLLCLSEYYQTHAQFENVMCCNQLGFTPSVVIPKDSLDDVLLAASMGDGYFIGDKWLSALRAPAFSFLPLGMFHTIHLLWMEENPTPLLQQLIYICSNEITWSPKEAPRAASPGAR